MQTFVERLEIPPALISSEEHSVAVISEVKSSVYRFYSGRESQAGDVLWKTVLNL